MGAYRLTYTETHAYHVVIDAESESAARQAFIDGDLGDDRSLAYVVDDSAELVAVDVLADESAEVAR